MNHLRTFLIGAIAFLFCMSVSNFAFAETQQGESPESKNEAAAKVAEMLEKARAGNAEAQAFIGGAFWQRAEFLFDEHRRDEAWKYEEQAFHWINAAADQEDPLGMYLRGKMYEEFDHNDVRGAPKIDDLPFHEQDPTRMQYAIHWYERAAESGESLAQLRLGRIFEARTGSFKGVERDPFVARKWLKMAAEQDLTSAYWPYAQIVMNGYGLTKEEKVNTYGKGENGINNRIKASVPWTQKAAAAGNGEASWYMRDRYLDNTFGQFNRIAAEYWLRMSYKQGYFQAEDIIRWQSQPELLAIAEVVLDSYKQAFANMDDHWEAKEFVIRDKQLSRTNDPIYIGILIGKGPNGDFATRLKCPTKDGSINCSEG